MPGLSQLKKFNADILSLGNEPALRASRGEQPVTVPIPKEIKELNDADDFLMGMPEPVETVEDVSQSENVQEDFSDIMGTETLSGEQKNEASAGNSAAPQINLSVPDISTIASGENGDSMPDLSMFDEPVQQSVPEEEIEPEPEKEPEIGDLSLEDLLGGEGFDGTQGQDDSLLTEENPEDNLEALSEVENIPEAEAVPEAEPYDEPNDVTEAENSGGQAEKSIDDLIAQATGNAEKNEEQKNAGDAEDSDSQDVEENFKNSDFQDIADLDIDSPDFFAEPEKSDANTDENSGENVTSESLDNLENLDNAESAPKTEETEETEPEAGNLEVTENPAEFEKPAESENFPETEDKSSDAFDDFDLPDTDFSFDDETNGSENSADSENLENPSDFAGSENLSDSEDSAEKNDSFDEPENSDSEESVSDAEKLADGFGSDFDFSFPENGEELKSPEVEAVDKDFAFDGDAIDMGEGLPDSVTEADARPKTEENKNTEETTPDSGAVDSESDDFPSDFNFDLNDTDSDSVDSDDGFQEQAPTEKFDTSEMEGLDFGIPDTDSALEKGNFELGNSNDFSSENSDFEIPGFSDVQTVEVNKNGKFKVANAENTPKETDGELPPNTLSDAQYKKFLKNLSAYPLNVRMAVEELIVKNEFTDEAEFEIIQKVLKKVSARQLASELEKMLDIAIPVPRDFERRTAEEYEAYKASFQYQLSNKIIPGAIISFAALIVFFFMFQFVRYFIYRPARASTLYSQGYKLLESENFPQSETKFSEATKYQLIKKWFFRYAHGYRNHKQFIRAEQMYKNILYCFNFDKIAGLEYAEMETKDLANYERAEEILLRDVLDHHINDADGILMLGDNYLEWADEKNPEKYDEALKRYSELVQLYGQTDKYMARMMRYYIRTDNLKEVLGLKERFFPRTKSLEPQDWTELSGYCLDKLYGYLAPSDEYLRTKIEDVKKMLVRAVQSDAENPVAYYNLGRYYINTNDSGKAEKSLQRSIQFFDKANVVKKKDYYKNIDSYRLLGEIYTDEKEYLKAMESFTDGITLFTNANISSGLEGNSKVGNLYADMGDIEYFISGNYDNALQNYQDAVNTDFDNGKIRYKIGYIQYSKKNYSEAVGSFMKTAEEYADDHSLLLAMGNTLSLRDDNFAAEGYYERLVEQIDNYRSQHDRLFPQTRKDDNELVETYLKASNNLGVTLYRLAKRTGSSAMNAKSMVEFQESMRAWDALTRNQNTMVRLGGSNLAEQNFKYVTNPMPEYEPAIYTELPRTLTIEKGLSQ